MSTEYSDRKTREILTKVNGQAKLAEQAIQALIQRDPAFLQSLVEPYINGIILHAIERNRKPAGVKEPKVAPAMPKTTTKRPAPAPQAVAKNLDSMMNAWAKSFEKDTPQPTPGGKKVSAKHLEAMQALIKKK